MLSHSTIALIILVLIIISFAAQVIPLPVTALLGGLTMMMAGIIEPSDVVSGFGSDTVMMVAGVIIIGNAVFETGLAQKIGNLIVRFKPASRNERVFLLIVLTLVTLLSAFISNTATVAIFLPLIASVANVSNGRITKKNTYMAVGIASVVGGNLTLAGSTPQLIAQGILSATDGMRTMTFFELLKGSIPVVILMLIYFSTIGYKLQQRVFSFPERADTSDAANETSAQKSGWKGTLVLVILVLVVIGFCAGIYSMGTVALLGACACIITGCISLPRAFETMDWNTLVVLGGAMGFSTGLSKSGAVTLIAEHLVSVFGRADESGFLICAMLILVAAVLGNLMSHTATVSILVPIGLSIASVIGIDPITVTVGIVIGCNLAFATPVGTPPITMTLVGGYRFSDYVKVGGLFNVVSLIFAMVTIPLLYGL